MAHKQIAHLTYDRIGADKQWYVLALAAELRRVVVNADEELLGPELTELKAELRQH